MIDAFTGLLVGTDASPAADRALDWALGFARQQQLAVRVVMAVSLPPAVASDPVLPVAAGYSPEVVDDYLEAMQAQLDEQVARVGANHPGVPIDATLVKGAPAATLLRQVRADEMLVVGRQGGSRLVDQLLGNIADTVLTHCHQPVVLVPQGAATPANGPVLVGIDQTGSRAALDLAGGLAARAGVPLLGVTAFSSRTMWNEPFTLGIPEALAGAAQRAQQALVAPVQHRHPELFVQTEVVDARPADALVARSSEASLVVVGSRGHGGFRGLLLGSTSRRVAQRSKAPVVVVRTEGLGEPSAG